MIYTDHHAAATTREILAGLREPTWQTRLVPTAKLAPCPACVCRRGEEADLCGLHRFAVKRYRFLGWRDRYGDLEDFIRLLKYTGKYPEGGR